MRLLGHLVLIALLYLHLGDSAEAQQSEANLGSSAKGTQTDANIVTGLDVSSSINAEDAQIQLRGMALAIQSPEILSAIQRGRHKRIGFSVFLWCDGGYPVVVAWRIIGSAKDAAAAAAQLTVPFEVVREAQTSGLTDLSRAIENGGALLKAAPFPSDRSVLNLVGNGEDNVGEGPQRARDALVASGGEINGVVIGGLPTILAYYQTAVVGGPMAFVVPVKTPENLVDAMRRKFVTEIAMALP